MRLPLLAAAACALALCARTAAADPAAPSPAPPAPLSESLKGDAKTAYDAATAAAANHDFAGALLRYGEAYNLSSDPRLLYNMAVCDRNLQHYAGMQTLLEQYVRLRGPALSPSEKAAVDAALAAVHDLVGAARIKASEDGASVFVDGQAAGTTPLPGPVPLDVGHHTIRVAKAGFADASTTLDAVGGAEAVVDMTMAPTRRVAHLSVRTEKGASILLDGQVVGIERYDADVAAGPHDLRATEDGKTPATQQVDLRDGETRTVELTPAGAKAGGIPTWVWIAGGAAVAAGLVVGGIFLFQTHDEPGPPPSGNLGTIFLTSFGGQ